MDDSYGRVTVAAVQAAPVVLERDATLAKLDALVQAAADRGPRIIVLPEAFVPSTWRATTPAPTCFAS
jgi:nitrilase